MVGYNRAGKLEKHFRLLSEQKSEDVPCIFISYQRRDEVFAKEVAEYIKEYQIDVFFDLDDINLKKENNPSLVTNAIKVGLNKSDYMLVIISSTTYTSPWVPFEIGYAYDKMNDKIKILRNKNLPSRGLPDYLKTQELLNGFISLNNFLKKVRHNFFIYESLENKRKIKSFSRYSNPLQNFLSNE